MPAQVKEFFDSGTSTFTYVVFDAGGGTAAILDPVLEYDHKAGRTRSQGCDNIIQFVREKKLTVAWILETHAHADHLSGASYLNSVVGGKIGVGSRIGMVQATFKKIFDLDSSFAVDGSQFDALFDDGATVAIGSIVGKTLFVPGHTPACVAFLFDDLLFVGDTLFMPDVGTARCDFPGGDARTLYKSIRRLLDLPPATRLFVCHDYPPATRGPSCETTVAAQRSDNIHVHDGISEEAFVAMRTARDKTLDMPLLIIPSIQVNIRAGRLPPAAANGTVYLKIPLNVL